MDPSFRGDCLTGCCSIYRFLLAAAKSFVVAVARLLAFQGGWPPY